MTFCTVDGCGRKSVAKGMCGRHYQQESAKRARSNGKYTGFCQHCGQQFRSHQAKSFCSIGCYLKSDLSKEIMAKAREESAKARGVEIGKRYIVTCLHCGKEKEVLPNRHKPRNYVRKNGKVKRCTPQKFCSRTCMRAWLSSRFDRHVANPEGIALPQCFDEFLSRDELPCIIDDCDWRGHNLSSHANFAHGITADELKEMAGFNKSTGLVSSAMSQELSARSAGKGNPLMAELADLEAIRAPRGSPRLEAIEHVVKAQAIMDRTAVIEGGKRWREANPEKCKELGRRGMEATKGQFVIRSCAMCGQEFHAPKFGTHRHCSDVCRNSSKRKVQKEAKERYRQKAKLAHPAAQSQRSDVS